MRCQRKGDSTLPRACRWLSGNRRNRRAGGSRWRDTCLSYLWRTRDRVSLSLSFSLFLFAFSFSLDIYYFFLPYVNHAHTRTLWARRMDRVCVSRHSPWNIRIRYRIYSFPRLYQGSRTALRSFRVSRTLGPFPLITESSSVYGGRFILIQGLHRYHANNYSRGPLTR